MPFPTGQCPPLLKKAPAPSSAIWGDMAQEVRAVAWQSEGCRFDPTLGVSKCPWARHLTPNCSWWAGWYLAWQPIAVGVWMRGINCTALWIKALYKCSPFTTDFVNYIPLSISYFDDFFPLVFFGWRFLGNFSKAWTLHNTDAGWKRHHVCEWVNERHTLYSALDKGAI